MTQAEFNDKLKDFSSVYTCISPPRVSSTAFARVFWEHPSIRYYCHEPFGVNYHNGKNLDEVAGLINNSLDLHKVDQKYTKKSGSSLFIKEMSFQLGDHFPLLANLAVKPLIFLIRNPKLNISSRISKKEATGGSRFFPYNETGWEQMEIGIAECRAKDIPYILVDASDFRNSPKTIFPQIFGALNLEFSNEMLTWSAYKDLAIDPLDGGSQDHFYERVLGSKGIQPADEIIPDLDSFPEERGLRDHVAKCVEIYENLLQDPNRVNV